MRAAGHEADRYLKMESRLQAALLGAESLKDVRDVRSFHRFRPKLWMLSPVSFKNDPINPKVIKRPAPDVVAAIDGFDGIHPRSVHIANRAAWLDLPVGDKVKKLLRESYLVLVLQCIGGVKKDVSVHEVLFQHGTECEHLCRGGHGPITEDSYVLGCTLRNADLVRERCRGQCNDSPNYCANDEPETLPSVSGQSLRLSLAT